MLTIESIIAECYIKGIRSPTKIAKRYDLDVNSVTSAISRMRKRGDLIEGPKEVAIHLYLHYPEDWLT